jgi:signal peptidase I
MSLPSLGARTTIGLACLGLLLLASKRRLATATVDGSSMQPTLNHGDRLLVLRSPPARISRGSLMVARPPTIPPAWQAAQTAAYSLLPPWVVKRIASMSGDLLAARAAFSDHQVLVPTGHVYLLGDSAPSVDSRQQADNILSVDLIYLPSKRATRRGREGPGALSTPMPARPPGREIGA